MRRVGCIACQAAEGDFFWRWVRSEVKEEEGGLIV